jgi:uncharacterized membrane protein
LCFDSFSPVASRENIVAYCTKCGAAVADAAAFCGACGAPQPIAGGNPVIATGPAGAPAQEQMAENIAGTLCYALGWLTGLIFYLIDKRPFVRFHAAQSIVVFGGIHILLFVAGGFLGWSLLTGGFGGFSLSLAFSRLVHVAALVLWVVLMIKAHRGERYRIPWAADIAESIFGRS